MWIDVSALPFLMPVPELAGTLESHLTTSPSSVLFGTDSGGIPTIPVGAEIQHAALSAKLREALCLALARMVREEVVELPEALAIGRGVLHGNAGRLHGWEGSAPR